MKPSTSYEEKFYKQGFRYIAGVDEAGRGPLAGPVVAAAVILPKKFQLDGLNDSKKLTPSQREKLFPEILKQAVSVGIGQIPPKVIDQLGILLASLKAMQRAVERMGKKPDFLLVDGRHAIRGLDIPQKTIIKGDQLSVSIAAASIVAKVTRDRIMKAQERLYPGYGFSQHKGYGTKTHLLALREKGFCPIHRRSFRTKSGRRFSQRQLFLDF